jgi:CheY-like chemotaxis protein
LMKAKQQVEEALRIKDQFLANMSHEIRTPMNAVLGFTNLLLKSEMSPEQKQYINAIKVSGENLIIIINDILDFSKIESGKVVFEKTKFNLSQVISSLVELMLPKSTEKNIKLSSSIDTRISDYLVGDPTRLTQILINLVGNAIKFTAKGSVKITVNLVEEKQKSTILRFSVADTGIGIPQNQLSSIFESFTQATNDTTRKYGGTGLGLTITKQLIELQGGKIWVESEVDKGSVFLFQLEFEKSVSSDFKTNGSSNNGTEIVHNIEGLNILLVEDNSLNQILAKKVLTDWKWNVEVADNGLIAIDKVEKNNYDVILMDIQMPEMDGYAATRHIREKLPSPKNNIPIIAMTAHAMTGEAEKCFNAGMNDYISKPFDQNKLYSKIISNVSKHKGILLKNLLTND